MRTFAYVLAVAVLSQSTNNVADGGSYFQRPQPQPQYQQESQFPQQPIYQQQPERPISQVPDASQSSQSFPNRLPAVNNQPEYGQHAPNQNAHSDKFYNFDLNLLKSVSNKNGGNFMISPASLKAVLFILAEGAGKNSQNEILSVLGLNDIGKARELWNNYNKLQSPTSGGVTIENANSLFLSKAYTINNQYNNIIKEVYDSDITAVDFSDPRTTANKINNWINKKTHGYIPQLVDAGSFDAQAVMVVANALYFKGIWKTKFSSVQKSMCFNPEPNVCIQPQMMNVETDLRYVYNQHLQFHTVEIPYLNERYAMLLLLPTGSIYDLINRLTDSLLSQTIDSLDLNEVNIYMPKFDIDYSEDLATTFREVGLQKIFGKDANLINIVQSSQTPQVDSIIHKTRLEVNEEGSVAAAGSGAMVVPLMGSTSIRLNFDKPFLFFICDIESKNILFAGRVNNPTKKINGNPSVPRSPPQNVKTMLGSNRRTLNNAQSNVQNNNYYNLQTTQTNPGFGSQSFQKNNRGKNDKLSDSITYPANNLRSYSSDENYPPQTDFRNPSSSSNHPIVYNKNLPIIPNYGSIIDQHNSQINGNSDLQNERRAVASKKSAPAEDNRKEANNQNQSRWDKIYFI